MLRVLKAFFPAVLATYVVASILATWSVMASLREMGVAVDTLTQLQATWHDILGMSSSYLLLIVLALLLAFPVASFLCRYIGRARLLLFVAAGVAALLCLHWLLGLSFKITLLAAAREPVGLLGQCLAGALGGWLYHLLSRNKLRVQSSH